MELRRRNKSLFYKESPDEPVIKDEPAVKDRAYNPRNLLLPAQRPFLVGARRASQTAVNRQNIAQSHRSQLQTHANTPVLLTSARWIGGVAEGASQMACVPSTTLQSHRKHQDSLITAQDPVKATEVYGRVAQGTSQTATIPSCTMNSHKRQPQIPCMSTPTMPSHSKQPDTGTTTQDLPTAAVSFGGMAEGAPQMACIPSATASLHKKQPQMAFGILPADMSAHRKQPDNGMADGSVEVAPGFQIIPFTEEELQTLRNKAVESFQAAELQMAEVLESRSVQIGTAGVLAEPLRRKRSLSESGSSHLECAEAGELPVPFKKHVTISETREGDGSTTGSLPANTASFRPILMGSHPQVQNRIV